MAAYSPISSRSNRILTQHNVIRRRDSLNSSIGATSVRRLIAVVRNTHGRYGPVYSRKLLVKNLVVLCISHIAVSVTFYPFLALQSSVSVWYYPLPNSNAFYPSNIHVGSLLIALGYLFAALSTLLGPPFVQKFGTNSVLFVFYVTLVIFFGSHFYPVLFVLVPVYVMFGLALGPVAISRIQFLMTLSSKLNAVLSEDDDDSKQIRKTCIVRRVARSFQAAQDVGLIIGSVLTALIITYTFDGKQFVLLDTKPNTTLLSNITTFDCNYRNGNCNLTYLNMLEQNNNNNSNNNNSPCEGNNTNCKTTSEDSSSIPSGAILDYTAFMNNMFDVDEAGDRLCGSKACPSYFIFSYNYSSSEGTKQNSNSLRVLSLDVADILTAIFIAISLLALFIAALGLDRIRLYVPQDPLERSEGFAALRAVKESFKDFRLQLAAPLAVFIGMEQAFMFSDFSKVRITFIRPFTKDFKLGK